MKNFPHQFNNLEKLYDAFTCASELIKDSIPLNDTNFGQRLTYEGIYTYRDKNLTIEEYLESENKKPASNRGYLTVSRDIRRLFQLLNLIIVDSDKAAKITDFGLELLESNNEEARKKYWKQAFWNLELEGSDGELSFPYRILIKLISDFPGIETSKLLLALEAENNSDEEYTRVSALVEHDLDEIIQEISTTTSMARNAVKILPGVAEQLGDLIKQDNHAYPTKEVNITEDDISSSIVKSSTITPITRANFWNTSAETIAKDPDFNHVGDVNIDLSNAIRIRQERLKEHQNCVRLLAALNESNGFTLYEGKFDCLATKENIALLYEVKTLSTNLSDLENQTVKAIGQLKYYNYSIVQKQMEFENSREIFVLTIKPTPEIFEFCMSIDVIVIWLSDDNFYCLDNEETVLFNPLTLL